LRSIINKKTTESAETHIRFDLGNVDREVNAGCGAWDGLASCWNAPSYAVFESPVVVVFFLA